MTDRRNFLRGRLSGRPATLRPPWAGDEDDFVSACTQCGDCARACPTHVIVRGDGGYPAIDFGKGECTFCAACVSACAPGALKRRGDMLPWTNRASIGDACLARNQVECRVCGEMCEVGAIRFRPQAGSVALPELDAEACIACGACVAPCPVGAIGITPQASR